MAVTTVRLCASSICQLRYPVCVGWGIPEKVDRGFLRFEDFRRFVDSNPGARMGCIST